MPFVEIKDFHALIEDNFTKKKVINFKNKTFFDQLVTSKQEAYTKFVKMSRNNNYKLYKNYTTGNLLDYSYNQNYYKPLGIDLSRQTNATIPQQINFKEKLNKKNDCVTMFFIFEMQ